MDMQRFRALSAHDRALVAIAVLLDGREATAYLEADAAHGILLKRAALDLAGLDPELRMPLTGTLLRSALQELRAGGLHDSGKPATGAGRGGAAGER